MKSFLSSLRKIDSSTHTPCDRITSRRQSQLLTTLLLSGAIIGGSIGLMVSSLPALAGTTVSSTPSISETGEAIGYTVDAVSLSNSYGTQTCTLTASRNFNITLPVGATVRKAILYWATDKTGGDSQVTLAGSTINATQSWNDQIQTTTKIFYGYRANVTSQITGAGTYSFSGLGGDLTSPFVGGCVSGASLIVIYDTTRSDPKALNRIEMFDGFEGIRGAGLASGGVSSTVTLPINSLGSDLGFMTALSWQGNFINEPPSVNGYPDTLTVNGTGVFNTNNPVNDNGNGSGANQAPNSVYAVDADTYDISSIVGNSTSLTITNTSGLNDYVISQGFVVGSRGPDVSDAPGSYGIARHKILPTLNTATPYLGSKVDGEVVDNTYAGSTNADFDDTNGADDDDGISSFPTLTAGSTSYSIPAANITARGTGTLHAWIDFNKNGTFDVGEYKSVAVTNNIPAGALDWTNITVGAAGNTFARFRFTTDATVTASTPSGLAADGEVEDYQVSITYTIAGNVFDDANGNKIQNSPAESGSNAGGLNAVLVNSLNKVVATTAVASDGTYTLNNVTSDVNPYTIRITATAATVGSAPPAIVLPTNWVSTGENLVGGTADTTVDSILSVTVTTSNVTGANFGIEQLPTTTAVTGTTQTNPGGTIQVQAPTLAGIDPEDGALGTGKSFKIISLPGNGTLYYNGTAVTANQVISSYDPTKLTLDPTIDGVTTVTFSYAAVDAAGQVGSTATASTSFTAALVSITGTVFNDTDSSKIQSGTEAGTNGGGLNAVLLNSSNAVVATTIVAANGTYSFSNVAPATYTVLITTGTTATVTLPTNWVSTGENLSGVADTTVDSKLLNVVVGSSNVTGANFGIKQNPADVLLLKRITAINGLNINPNDNKSLTGVLVDPSWKAGYVVGATDGGKVKPGDTIEYTIYYLNNGGRNAKTVRICDRLNANQTFYPDTYPNSTFIQNNTTNPNPVGSGMQVQKGTSAALTLTNTSDSDGGQFIAATSPASALPTDCNSITGAPNNDYGALILDLVTSPGSPNLTALPGKTGQGSPNDSFGLWRFITKVNKVSP